MTMSWDRGNKGRIQVSLRLGVEVGKMSLAMETPRKRLKWIMIIASVILRTTHIDWKCTKTLSLANLEKFWKGRKGCYASRNSCT
jgi:hypothetical protein